MCGITAAVLLQEKSCHAGYRQEVTTELENSLDAIYHRGPDAQGIWISEDDRVAFGHNRLSIKDLSAAGDQPLHNADNSVHAIINGEFYEYDRLRSELENFGYVFNSTSDSELLLALYERDGIGFFSHLRGEFSFCLYDERRQIIIAARDRYGVKPLFWTQIDGRLLFASEAKAFLAYGWKPEWDVRSIVEDGWIHDHRTMFKGVRKLLPGHYMTVTSFDYITQQPYWEVEYADKNVRETRSMDEMILGLRRKLYEAVEVRTQGDVPMGIYLSGGIDSAVVAGIAADVMAKKKKDNYPPGMEQLVCFTVGFEKGTEFDETPLAQRTADFLGLPLIQQRLDEQTFADNFEIAYLHSEHLNPDLNSVAKFILSGLVQNHGVKVVLSGEGSDEHFTGYRQYMSDFIREPDNTFGENPLTESKRKAETRRVEYQTLPGYKGINHEYSQEESSLSRRMLNDSFIGSCLWTVTLAPFASWTRHAFGRLSIPESRSKNPGAKVLSLIQNKWHPVHAAQHVWTRSILPNFILTGMGDRMEMAHSIEGRPPFLDHELTHFANSLPPSAKVLYDPATGDLREKWILREASKPFITQEMYERRKHPFSAPHKYSVGGPLHKLFSRLITRANVTNLGFVDVDRSEWLLSEAFSEKESAPNAIRCIFIIAQWVVLSQAFGIATAQPVSFNRSGRENRARI